MNISLKESLLFVRLACIAGVLVSVPNFNYLFPGGILTGVVVKKSVTRSRLRGSGFFIEIAIGSPVRIANQLALLNIYISASTVRNILRRPFPPRSLIPWIACEETLKKSASRTVPARYPNHAWSIDITTVLSWVIQLLRREGYWSVGHRIVPAHCSFDSALRPVDHGPLH